MRQILKYCSFLKPFLLKKKILLPNYHVYCYSPRSRLFSSHIDKDVSRKLAWRKRRSSHQQQKDFAEKDGEKSKPIEWEWSVWQQHKDCIKSIKLPPFIQRCEDFTEDHLRFMPITELISYARLVRQIDRNTLRLITTLSRRIDSMSVEQMITVADMFVMNRVPNLWFTSALLSYISEMFELLHMTPAQLTRLAMHLEFHGDYPVDLIIALEREVYSRLEEFDMTQISLVFMVFFLQGTPIRSIDLLDKIAHRILTEFETVKSRELCSFMKIFRFSNYNKVSFFKDLGDLIIKTDGFSGVDMLYNVMHCAWTYATLHITHPQLFLYILKCLLKEQYESRIKDFSKIISSCGILGTSSQEHLELLLEIVDRLNINKKVAVKYPETLAEMTYGLALLGIYSPSLLNLQFDPDVIQNLLELSANREKFRQIDFVHSSIAIESPNYSGNLITQDALSFVKSQLKILTLDVRLSLQTDFSQVLDAVKDALGSECVACDCILRHWRSVDLLLCFDQEECQFVPPPVVQFDGSSHLVTAAQDRFQYVVILVPAANQYTKDGHLFQRVKCRQRQLLCVGYNVITISPDECNNLMNQHREATREYLMSRVNAVIKQRSLEIK